MNWTRRMTMMMWGWLMQLNHKLYWVITLSTVIDTRRLCQPAEGRTVHNKKADLRDDRNEPFCLMIMWPRWIMSSPASFSSGSAPSPGACQRNLGLNSRAVAVVTNRWYREQRRAGQYKVLPLVFCVFSQYYVHHFYSTVNIFYWRFYFILIIIISMTSRQNYLQLNWWHVIFSYYFWDGQIITDWVELSRLGSSYSLLDIHSHLLFLFYFYFQIKMPREC